MRRGEQRREERYRKSRRAEVGRRGQIVRDRGRECGGIEVVEGEEWDENKSF